MGFYEIFFVVTGIFVLYTWYVLVSGFSEKEEVPKNKILITLSVYFAASNLMHFVTTMPIVNLVLTIGVLSVMSFLMNYSRKKMILTVVYSMILLMAVDTVVFVMAGFFVDSLMQETTYNSSLGRLITIILVYALGMGMRNFKNIRRNLDIPTSYWITLVIFPILSIAILVLMLKFSRLESDTVTLMSMMIIVMNWIVFSLYDRLMALHNRQIEDLTVSYLNDSYKKQLDTMKASINNVHGIQHDIGRHLISLTTLLGSRKYEEAGAYIDAIREQVTQYDMLSITGNDVVDSIIHFEIQHSGIDRERIMVDTRQVPEKMTLSDYEMTIVLSNLLRNALQAVQKVEQGTVDLKMEYQQGMLKIRIDNDFDGVLNEQAGKLFSRHTSERNRGFGLKNVERVIDKNHGVFRRTQEDGRFCVEAMLYTQAIEA